MLKLLLCDSMKRRFGISLTYKFRARPLWPRAVHAYLVNVDGSRTRTRNNKEKFPALHRLISRLSASAFPRVHSFSCWAGCATAHRTRKQLRPLTLNEIMHEISARLDVHSICIQGMTYDLARGSTSPVVQNWA